MINELIEMAVNCKESVDVDCDIELIEDDKKYKAYSCSVSNCELLFYTDKAVISYDVNKIGFDYSLLCNSVEVSE